MIQFSLKKITKTKKDIKLIVEKITDSDIKRVKKLKVKLIMMLKQLNTLLKKI